MASAAERFGRRFGSKVLNVHRRYRVDLAAVASRPARARASRQCPPAIHESSSTTLWPVLAVTSDATLRTGDPDLLVEDAGWRWLDLRA